MMLTWPHSSILAPRVSGANQMMIMPTARSCGCVSTIPPAAAKAEDVWAKAQPHIIAEAEVIGVYER